LFFNADTWPAIEQRATTVLSEQLDRVRDRADGDPPDPYWDHLEWPPPRDGTTTETRDWGDILMSAAFVYRIEPDAARLQKIKEMLQASLDYYHASYEQGHCVNWYSTSRVSWLAALDWVWNDLSEQERTDFGLSFLDHVDDVHEAEDIVRRNDGGHTTGYYGGHNIAWFAGVVLRDEGIDDERAAQYYDSGYQIIQDLLAHRSGAAGVDGGAASSTLGYALAAYPWVEWNFLYGWQSSTDQDVSGDWPYIALFPKYVLYNRLPGDLEFGYGDAQHTTNALPKSWLYTHMSHAMHFYGQSHPGESALAAYVRDVVGGDWISSRWSVYPFLMTEIDSAPPAADPGELGQAFLFENMGQVFMRSGSTDTDTYALFAAGGILDQHRHYDATHFSIYHRGFLALDTGTRWNDTENLPNYYAQTVAHNAVLIKMPGEEPSNYWGGTVHGQAGGQYEQLGSQVIAFETSDDFSYVAADATATYRSEKCSEMVRQLVFVPPYHFVVFDRVTSTDASYGKRWLLHHANQPVVSGDTWRGDQDQGRLFCRTLLPTDAQLQAVGGPGQEFMADGVNYPISGDPGDITDMMGRWRMEVSPGSARTADVFLHLIEVGDQGLSAMSTHSATEDGSNAEVTFDAGSRTVTLRFAKTGAVGGHITIVDGAQTPVDRALTTSVQN
ncbi:MAG: heparinase II/III family protein, partial [Deltaproteobacteria bacterium]|nr:heparinase II/III family protein [Deltaproteobacteria bacterium]